MGKKKQIKSLPEKAWRVNKKLWNGFFVGHFYFVCTFSFDEGCRLLQ
jgi:hypothetical protein